MIERNELPNEIMRLVDGAASNGAAVIILDPENNFIYQNEYIKDVYPFLESGQYSTYDSIFWNCLERNLLDDPPAYEDPHKWLAKALDYRKNTQFSQYLIRHHNGRIYLARHQVFPGFGTFLGRLNITENFRAGFENFAAAGSYVDPITGNVLAIANSGKSDLASALISRSGVVVNANKQLLELAERRDGFYIQDGRISTILGSEKIVLHKAIERACNIIESPSGSMLRISRREKNKYYILNVALIPSGSWTEISQLRGMCLVHAIDPSNQISIPPSILQKTFDLTPAEARVALALASGNDVQEISQKNNVSVGTVRNQIKSVFQKTGVNRQSELVKTVVSISRLISV